MNKHTFKIIFPAILSMLLFILTIFLIIIPHFRESIMDDKREMIKELTNTACSVLSEYENDEKKGVLTREEAQQAAISRIRFMRYGEANKDYFWITDLKPTMIIHPYRLDLNGKDLSNLSDPYGKKLFVECVNIVKQSGHGYVDYMWQWKDDSQHIVPKLSYVRLFEQWGWVIGTGVYLDDAKKEIDRLTKKLLWISSGISVVVAFLLLFIFQQSLKIERSKTQAEKELHESKEKYKTLVEAATEGLIMVLDGRISFANSVVSVMTGYEHSELIDIQINNLINENTNSDIIEKFSKNIITDGQYEINLKRKNGGFIEVLVTASTGIFFDKAVNILIFKDISLATTITLSSLDYQKLLRTLDVGFFRALIDYKGKFIFANETAIKILGFDNFREMSEIKVFDMLVEPEDKKELRNVVRNTGFVKNKILKIQKKNHEFAMISVTLVTFNSENQEDLVCDGIIEDITVRESEKRELNSLITELKSNNFLIEQPVKNYLSPVVTADIESTVGDVINILAKKKSDNLLITKNGTDYIGVITNNDIQKRVLALDLHLENPAYLIMSAPIAIITEETSVLEAVRICENKNINHLAIRNESREIIGILRTNDIYRTIKNSLSFFTANAAKAETMQELKQYYTKIQLLVKPLVNSKMTVKHITNITSLFSDAVIQRVIELTMDELGQPPVSFSFICLGSEGRKEETLFTDQDNAIIYEEIPKKKESEVFEYFTKFSEKVCNSLNYIGYTLCKGNIMAKNRQWCKPINAWEKYFLTWISTPESQNLLEAMIFFDFRHIYGNDALPERLRNTIQNLIKLNPAFLYNLAHNTFNVKLLQIASATETIDLKLAIGPIVMCVRAYSLQNDIRCTNTIERLHALRSKLVIDVGTIDDVLYAYNLLMEHRFKNQIYQLDNILPLNNILNIKKLTDIDITILKKVLSTISAFQNKLGHDFRIQT